MNINQIWKDALVLIEKDMSQVMFDTAITPIEPISYTDGIFTLKVKDDFWKQTIKQRYLPNISDCIRSIMNEHVDVSIISPEDLDESNHVARLLKQNYEKTNLRSRFVFETFVKGNSNELAYNAALAVAESPGTNYNPLFLYGGVGLGKTHLVQAIGNYMFDNNSNKNIMYVTAETFTNECIQSIRDNRGDAFREKYRAVDALIVDDVQFLAGKDRTQEEFFYTFNDLINQNKQIVLTSDLPPKDLKGLEVRLTSRFSQGLVTDITMPDYETRAAILEKKLNQDNQDLPQEVKDFITQNIVSNVRDLEGALNKIMAYSKLTKTSITLAVAQEALKDLVVGREKPELTMQHIQDIIANHYKISIDDMNSPKRSASLVLPRQVAIYFCHAFLQVSTPEIGKFFGNRNHSTVIHSCQKVTDRMEQEESFRLLMQNLEIRIKGE